MTQFIYRDYSLKDRITLLKNQAIKTSVETYNRSLSDKEVDAEKDRYSRDAIELDRQEEELKRQSELLKAGIKSLETLMKERLTRIKTGQMEVHGMLYGIPDHNNGRMNYYDQYGELVNNREMLPDEWQGRLFIGDSPSEGGSSVPVRDSDVTDVEFEETAPEAAVEDVGDVQVEQTAPEEDKPKKKKSDRSAVKRSPKKGKATEENEDDNPI